MVQDSFSLPPPPVRSLSRLVPTNVTWQVVDDSTYFEIMPDWAKNISVGFARMEGHPVGIVANNPLFLAGCLDIDTSTKASQLILTLTPTLAPILTVDTLLIAMLC